MTQSRLIELSYYDPSAQVRLSAYADTVVLDHNSKGGIISAVRFGGYPEMVRAMSDAIYGGATIEATQNSTTRMLQSNVKGYQRQMSHDGVYAVATLMASDDAQTDDRASEGDGEVEGQEAMQPRKCYIFCPQGDRDRLFEELDHKTAAPLIPAFRDYVLDALQKRGDLRQLEVISLKEKMDAWVLDLKPEDRNVVEVLETGLKNGSIQIPGAIPGAPDGFDGVENVTGYLNTFGVTVADRIRHQFMPLFDPANEPLSDEVLAINDCIMNRAGYSLYDAQLAVAEAVKRQLDRKSVALIIAECGAGKTKIGSTALGALHGLWAAQKRSGADKSFGIIMCPSHVTRKWVREIGETLPDTYAMVMDDAVDVRECCRKAEELFELYQSCANRKQIETICTNFLRGIEATKLSITGHMYFVPRTYMERVDIFEDFITLLSGLNKKQTPLVVNSFYIIDDAKQRDKMTEEFYLAVKKEIATYQEKCDYLIKSGSQSPAVMDRWVLKVQALEQKKRHYEGVLQRELDGLDDEFSVLKFLSQELQVRANSIRSQRFPTKKAA